MVFLTSGPLAMPDVAAPGRGGAAMPIRTQAAVTAWKGRGVALADPFRGGTVQLTAITVGGTGGMGRIRRP